MNTTELAAYKTQKKLGVDKNQKWASTDLEQLQMVRKLFREHLDHWNYDKEDTRALMRIFDMQINEGNIKNYVSLGIKDLYTLLIHNKL